MRAAAPDHSAPGRFVARPAAMARLVGLVGSLGLVGFVAGLIVGLVALTAGPALAHTDLIQGSPGPGQQTGGTVDFVDLAFLEPVTDAVVALTFEGNPVPGQVVTAEGQIIRFEFDEPLSQPGRYELTYEVTAADLDRVEEGYFFVYEPGSPAPRRIGQPPVDSEDNTVMWIVVGVLSLICVAGAAILARNWLELRRRRAGAEVSAGD